MLSNIFKHTKKVSIEKLESISPITVQEGIVKAKGKSYAISILEMNDKIPYIHPPKK